MAIEQECVKRDEIREKNAAPPGGEGEGLREAGQERRGGGFGFEREGPEEEGKEGEREGEGFVVEVAGGRTRE
eukprot:1282057-Amorphochlora_amoeboformis.AAC.1